MIGRMIQSCTRILKTSSRIDAVHSIFSTKCIVYILSVIELLDKIHSVNGLHLLPGTFLNF